MVNIHLPDELGWYGTSYAATLWLLLSDPVAAAGVVERGNLLPVFVALAKIVGKAISAVMAAL